MTHNEHEHEHHEHEHHGRHGGHPMHKRKPFHRDWRAWVVVGLMLAAMYAYIMSMDESLQPGKPVQGPVMPAAPAPPAAL
jgi:hypothetical protein